MVERCANCGHEHDESDLCARGSCPRCCWANHPDHDLTEGWGDKPVDRQISDPAPHRSSR